MHDLITLFVTITAAVLLILLTVTPSKNEVQEICHRNILYLKFSNHNYLEAKTIDGKLISC